MYSPACVFCKGGCFSVHPGGTDKSLRAAREYTASWGRYRQEEITGVVSRVSAPLMLLYRECCCMRSIVFGGRKELIISIVVGSSYNS